jgi:SAM-dependent methyltransferase
VVGIDRASPSVQTARQRATAAGAMSVHFEETELETFVAAQKFDAVIGRLVLMYLPDPAAVLQRLRHCLRQGGIMAFQEIDISQVSQAPASALLGSVMGWINAAFRAGGAELDMGSKLLATFLRAGVPRPTMIAAARVESGPQSPAYEYLTGVLRSLLPIIERGGIATAEQIGIETLADRLRHDAVANERVTFLPRLVSAWSRFPT